MTFEIPTVAQGFYLASSPIYILVIAALIHMFQAVIPKISGSNSVFGVSFFALIAALGARCVTSPTFETAYLGGALLSGQMSTFGQGLIIAIALAVLLMIKETSLGPKFFRGEIACLFLMVVLGMLILVATDDIISLFVGLELSSIGLYVLVGYIEPTRKSQEGAIKYFVLGSFGAALLLMGFALIYSVTGSLRISELVDIIPKLTDHRWVQVGILFTLCGLAFKLSLAPFHLWAPDAYEAAPTGITAFMATTVKAMILIVTIRFFSRAFTGAYDSWIPCFIFLAICSMIIGNIMALVQASLKRMLAYSSIAHGGYMAVALCAVNNASGELPIAAVLYYLISYTLISLTAFGVIMWLEKDRENLLLDDICGLAKKHPWAALALSLSMFAFAGLPPTSGFIGKLFVFKAALENQLYGLVIIGAIGSAISIYYYLRVIVKIYMEPASQEDSTFNTKNSLIMTTLGAVFVAAILLLGTVLPDPILHQLIKAAENVALNE